MYYLYMLRCEDESIYTGISTSVERRFREHFSGGRLGAKYTKVHKPKELLYSVEIGDRSKASEFEYKIKHLNRLSKERLILKCPTSVEELESFLAKNKKFWLNC